MVKRKPKKTPEEKEQAKKSFERHNPGVKPYPTPEPDSMAHIGPKEKKKRYRRTDEEIQRDLETERIREDGYETIAVFFKSLSDNDAAQYGIPKQSIDFFYPVSKNYAKILNYFLPKAKEIYFVITMTAFQSWNMLKARAELIREKTAQKPKPEAPKQSGPGPAPGFPQETQQQHV